jgi:peptidylprolyl isomerase
MSFNDSDFIKIEYSAWRKADNQLVYTTDQNKAKEGDIYNENTKYGPQLVVLGRSEIIKGLEQALRGMELNQAKRIDLEPAQAFGERDPNLVKVMSLSDFKSRDISPYPGMQLDLDGVTATVRSVTSGRVMVDANHPLAGESLTYEVKVVSKIDKDEDKIVALSDSYSLKPTSVRIENRIANIEFGSEIDKNSDYLVNKSSFVKALLKYMDGIEKVDVKEEYTREKKEKKEESKEKKEENKK